MRRLFDWAPVILLVLLVALFAGWRLSHRTPAAAGSAIGLHLPATPVTPLSGGAPRPLNTAVRGPVLVNVFASWCAPCRIEHPVLQQLKARGLPVVGLAWKDRPEATAAMLKELGDPYREVLNDQKGAAAIGLKITGVPQTLLVDARGVVIDSWSAPMTDEDAERLASELKREMAKGR